MSRDDTDETTTNGVTRRAFARAAAIGVGALSLPGLAAAHHDNRSEQGERNGNDNGAHGNGNGRGRGRNGDDDPGNSGEHRHDDEAEDDEPEDDEDGEEGDDEDENGENGDDDGGGGGEDGGGDDDRGNAQVAARRDEDSSAFVLPQGPGTDTAKFDLIVEQASQPVFIRDQFPSDWTVEAGDPYTTYTQGSTRFVEFTNRVEGDDTRTYFADVPDNTGVDEFGPIEFSIDGETWTKILGTTEEIVVAAQGTGV